jgi:hypothetical protein
MGDAVLAMLTCAFVSFGTAVRKLLFVSGCICLNVAIVTYITTSVVMSIAAWLA